MIAYALFAVLIVAVVAFVWYAAQPRTALPSWSPQATALAGQNREGPVITRTCPQGSWVSALTGSSDQYVNSLGMQCSDGTVYAPSGVPAQGRPFSDATAQGLSALNVREGAWMDGVQAVGADGTKGPVHGGSGGDFGPLACPTGQVAVGITQYQNGNQVGAVGLMCNAAPVTRRFWWHEAARSLRARMHR